MAKVEISIPKKKRVAGPRARRLQKKGPLASRRGDDDILLRRVANPALFNFYDLGQVLDGSNWVDIDHSYLDVDAHTGSFPSDPDVHVTSKYELPQVTELMDLIFSVPTGDWDTNFRKLEFEPAEKYGVIFLANNSSHGAIAEYPVGRNGSYILGTTVSGTKWTADGLRVPLRPPQFAINAGIAFEAFSSDTSIFKITKEQSYAADEESFTLAETADVFLMPLVQNHAALFSDETALLYEALFNKYRAVSREFWLDRTDTNFTNSLFAQPPSVPVLDFSNSADWISLVKAESGARYFTLEFSGGVGRDVSEGSPASFPTYDFFRGYMLGQNFFIQAVATARVWGSFPPGENPELLGPIAPNIEGQLVGVVKQNDEFYYFWHKDTELSRQSLILLLTV